MNDTGTTIEVDHYSAHDIHIGNATSGSSLIVIHPNGEFSLAEGLTPTDAAMAIWRALSGLIRYARFPLRAQVIEFHRAFGHPIAEAPAVVADVRVRFRANLIAEEFFEAMAAMFVDGDGQNSQLDRLHYVLHEFISDAPVKVDLPELADAFGDLDYVVEGSRLEFGIDGAPVATAIHAANMSKLGPDGNPIRRADGKSLKPDGWTPPDIAGELRKQGW